MALRKPGPASGADRGPLAGGTHWLRRRNPDTDAEGPRMQTPPCPFVTIHRSPAAQAQIASNGRFPIYLQNRGAQLLGHPAWGREFLMSQRDSKPRPRNDARNTREGPRRSAGDNRNHATCTSPAKWRKASPSSQQQEAVGVKTWGAEGKYLTCIKNQRTEGVGFHGTFEDKGADKGQAKQWHWPSARQR